MGERTGFVEGIATGVVVGSLAGLAVAFFWYNRDGDDTEDRPPIVVSEGSIEFSHGHKWNGVGGKKKWKPNHANGRSVTGYDVMAVNRTDLTVCLATGKKITIDYEWTDGSVKQFVLSLEQVGGSGKFEPTLDSPDDLDDTNKWKLKLGDARAVRAVADENGRSCTFTANKDVQVYVSPKH
jgi:hypothetical protein